MKKYLIVAIVSIISSISLTAQDFVDPIKYLEGVWLLKVTNIDPVGSEPLLERANSFVSFESFLEGKGLKQITYHDLEEAEVYLFYDVPTGTFYGNTVDDNGYVWQTMMSVDKKGDFKKSTGGPVSDSSLKVESQLTKISQTEMRFVHSEMKDGKRVIKAEGTFHRLPKY